MAKDAETIKKELADYTKKLENRPTEFDAPLGLPFGISKTEKLNAAKKLTDFFATIYWNPDNAKLPDFNDSNLRALNDKRLGAIKKDIVDLYPQYESMLRKR